MDVGRWSTELTARVSEELDYTLEAAAQQQAAGVRRQCGVLRPAGAGEHDEGDGQRVGRGTRRCPRGRAAPTTSGTRSPCATCGSCSPARARWVCCTPIRTRATSRCWPTAGSGWSTSAWSPGCPTDCRRRWAGSCASPRTATREQVGEELKRRGLRRLRCRRRGPDGVSGAVRRTGGGGGVPVHPGVDARAVHPGPRPAGLRRGRACS